QARPLRRLRQSHLRRRHPQDRKEQGRQVLECPDRDLPAGVAILEVRSYDLHEAATLFPRLPRDQEGMKSCERPVMPALKVLLLKGSACQITFSSSTTWASHSMR